MKKVMTEIKALAVPHKSHEYIPLWYSLHNVNRPNTKEIAMQNGNGFELIELNHMNITNEQRIH